MRLNTNSPQIKMITYGYNHLTDWSQAIPVRGHWRMWWNEQAGAAISYNHKLYPINNERIPIVPPNTPIKHILNNPVNSLCFHFNLGQPYDAFAGKVIHFLLPEHFSVMMHELSLVLRDFEVDPQVSTRFSFQVYSLILKGLTNIKDEEWPSAPQNQQVREAILLMENNLNQPLPNEIIAKKLNLSTNSWVKTFKKAMKISPQKYFQYRRLELASIELIHTDDSIEDIAERCGFCDRYYFTRQFRKRYGIGPASYRKKGF